MPLWLVRAGKDGEFEQVNLNQGVVSIGWSDALELRGVAQREEVAARIRQLHEGETTARLSNWTGQVWAFVGRIAAGDLVIMPL